MAALHAPDAVLARGVRRQPRRRRAAGDLRHLLPQRDAGLRVVAGARGNLHADEIGVALVVAVEFQVQQAAALAGKLADVAADHQADGQRADIGERDLGGTGARMLAQGVRHLVAQHHRQLVVGELERVDDAREHGDLAARHAQGVDRRRLDDDHLPGPVLGAAVPLVGVRQQLLGDALHALGLRIVVGEQGVAADRLGAQLAVLLQRRLLQAGGRDEVAHDRGAPHLDALVIVLGALCRRRHAGNDRQKSRCAAMIERRMMSSPISPTAAARGVVAGAARL